MSVRRREMSRERAIGTGRRCITEFPSIQDCNTFYISLCIALSCRCRIAKISTTFALPLCVSRSLVLLATEPILHNENSFVFPLRPQHWCELCMSISDLWSWKAPLCLPLHRLRCVQSASHCFFGSFVCAADKGEIANKKFHFLPSVFIVPLCVVAVKSGPYSGTSAVCTVIISPHIKVLVQEFLFRIWLKKPRKNKRKVRREIPRDKFTRAK